MHCSPRDRQRERDLAPSVRRFLRVVGVTGSIVLLDVLTGGSPVAAAPSGVPHEEPSLLQGAVDAVDPVLDPVEPVLDPVEPVLDDAVEVVEPVVDGLTEPVGPVLDEAAEAVDPLVQEVTEAVEPVVDPLAPLLEPVDPIVDGVQDVLDPATRSLDPLLDTTEQAERKQAADSADADPRPNVEASTGPLSTVPSTAHGSSEPVEAPTSGGSADLALRDQAPLQPAGLPSTPPSEQGTTDTSSGVAFASTPADAPARGSWPTPVVPAPSPSPAHAHGSSIDERPQAKDLHARLPTGARGPPGLEMTGALSPPPAIAAIGPGRLERPG